MQSSGGIRNRSGATRPRRTSLTRTDGADVIDLKLMEAIQRIERVRSKALMAVGTMIADR